MSDTESGFIPDPHSLAAKIQEWKQKGYHVLSPAINMTAFATGYAVNASFVVLDPTVDERGRGTDVYFDKNTLKDHERGLSKIALGRIAAAVGVSWLPPPASGRRDPLTIQNLWIYQITGAYLAYDGTPQTIHGEKEIDYRDGSAQIGEWTPAAWAALLERAKTDKSIKYSINGWSESRVRQARTNGAERAETGAMERAIRMGFGIKHAYTVEELKKPFVTLRVCPVMDMNDPGVRAMVTAGQIGGVAALYGSVATSSPRQLGPKTETIDITPIRADAYARAAEASQAAAGKLAETVVREAVEKAAEAPRAPEQAPPPQERRQADRRTDAAVADLPAGAFYVKDVQAKEIPYRANHPTKAGKTFTKWFVTTDAGEVAITMLQRWSNLAEELMRDGAPTTWTLGEANSYGEREILSLARAIGATE